MWIASLGDAAYLGRGALRRHEREGHIFGVSPIAARFRRGSVAGVPADATGEKDLQGMEKRCGCVELENIEREKAARCPSIHHARYFEPSTQGAVR